MGWSTMAGAKKVRYPKVFLNQELRNFLSSHRPNFVYPKNNLAVVTLCRAVILEPSGLWRSTLFTPWIERAITHRKSRLKSSVKMMSGLVIANH